MQQKISCFEVLEELYENHCEFRTELEKIKFDITILKKYIHLWQSYSLLKKIQDLFLPRRFRGSNSGFIEDYKKDEHKEWKSFAAKGTTKFILSLVFQETREKTEKISDMLQDDTDDFIDNFFEDKEEKLQEMHLSEEDKELIKESLMVVKDYSELTGTPRYDIFECDISQLNIMKLYLLKFLIYLEEKDNWDLSYEELESYLNPENMLEPLEEMTYRIVTSDSDTEVQKNLMGISFVLAKLRMGITDSVALQTRAVTKAKGSKNLLNFSTNMNLKELSEENKNLQKELEDLLKPLLSSQLIRTRLYECYFERRGNLQI
ncbi:hypothetical protein Q7V23_07140 [Streptococcus suis]|nr:hypothetical protein [Streptococcus suis]MDW8589790.1 hypothetical protein [Streptococcus suis]MDW8615404.1 hypothetical protein [Streptococcus suis]